MWPFSGYDRSGADVTCELSQRTYDAIITSWLRQNDVVTSFWHNDDVIITSFISYLLFPRYLPTEVEQQKKVHQFQSGAMLIFNTRKVYWNFLHWAILCTLTKDCIAPIDQIVCNFTGLHHQQDRADCHRYDQSVVNLILSEWWGYDELQYTPGRLRERLVTFQRWPTTHHTLQWCRNEQVWV